ncbi:MAG: hypothetical protein K2L51_02395, partial [Clostridiales bacterium]|nr:hypothetical protein [Clostridiales bacterium]
AARVAEIYDRCMRRNEEYLAVREKFRTLAPARQRYFLLTGIRLIRNLFLYREKEELIQKKTYDLERMKRLNAYIPRLEWLGVGPYKELIGELFPAEFCAQFALDETFADVCNRQRELERVLRKLEFYLVREADTPPMQRTYSS